MELPVKAHKVLRGSDQNKLPNNVTSAGGWARSIGWIVLVGSPVVLFLTRTNYDTSTILIWLTFVVLISAYLIWSGKYIQNNGGPAVSKLLFLNGFILLIGVRGIIPLIASISSFMCYSNYKKLRKSGELPKFDKKKANPSKKEIGIFIALVIVGFILVIWGGSDSSPMISPEVRASKSRMDSLTEQYQTCSASLATREKTLNLYSQYAVDSYNADYNACETIRLDQNAEVDKYNKLLGL